MKLLNLLKHSHTCAVHKNKALGHFLGMNIAIGFLLCVSLSTTPLVCIFIYSFISLYSHSTFSDMCSDSIIVLSTILGKLYDMSFSNVCANCIDSTAEPAKYVFAGEVKKLLYNQRS